MSSPPTFDDDEAALSSQLNATLQTSITTALSTRRPLLTHLNADTTWLLSLPYPPTHLSVNGRIYYHILIDPWLRGGQSDVAKFFSQQWHAEASVVQTVAEIEDAVRAIESVAHGGHTEGKSLGKGLEVEDMVVHDEGGGEVLAQEPGRGIDAIVVSHEFTDHMHKDTLLEAPTHIPVFAATKAAAAIRSWKHFEHVEEIPRFGGDWRESSSKQLPDWIGLSRVAFAGQDLLYYHSAVMVAFRSTSVEGEEAEAVIYTPHGVSTADLAPVATASPAVKTLALLHGLQDIKLGAQLNMGAHNGLKVQRLLRAKYWVGTHDEVKKGGGLVSWFLDRKAVSLKEAIDLERHEKGVGLEESVVEGLSEVRFEDLKNGESLILE